MAHDNAIHHYNPVAKGFHWVVAALAFVVWPLGFLTGLVKSGVSNDFYFWHESLGFTVLWLMLARLCVRFLTDTPAKPAGIPRWQAGVAHVSQWLLYLLLIAQPVVGFLLTNAQGFKLNWFGVVSIGNPIGKSSAAAGVLGKVHEWQAWTILGLVALHLCGALYHRIVRRDDTLARMT